MGQTCHQYVPDKNSIVAATVFNFFPGSDTKLYSTPEKPTAEDDDNPQLKGIEGSEAPTVAKPPQNVKGQAPSQLTPRMAVEAVFKDFSQNHPVLWVKQNAIRDHMNAEYSQ